MRKKSCAAGAQQPVAPGTCHYVVMGVSGVGKTTVGRAVADRTGLSFIDADDYHPAANIKKMAAGTPLDDADRGPWLSAVVEEMARYARHGKGLVIACSALKKSYRDLLRRAPVPVAFIHLVLAPATARARLAHRRGHFMPAGLLGSQLSILEPLTADEYGVTVSNDSNPDKVADTIAAWIASTSDNTAG